MDLSLLEYLEQPSLLSEVSLEELLSLVDRYPFVTTLNLLVLLKARQINSPDTEKYLNRVAVSTFDRAHLYHLLAALDKEEEDRGEVLELLQLDELELEPLTAPGFGEALPSRLNELPTPPADPAEDADEDAPPPVFDELPQAPRPAPAKQDTVAEWVATAAAYWPLLPRTVRQVRPEDPGTFARVLLRRERSADLGARLRRLRERPAPATANGAGPGNTGESASVVVSETLAALLVRQGQYQNAIRMYQRLGLLYPEKKPIFAGLIKELKGKL
ncbi:hypothetical protein [Lewinella sp. IMCC34183]|uniref:hypothetical protein n=1 Tax=Lewinella sp. IMCC34183 TaxID=2248762 RepID=UPI0013006769|nr:hypothetical protein [Lewinella sp. IMCC34183]